RAGRSGARLPASARRLPPSRWNSVVLPAPLGPMMPSASPPRASSDTSSVTTRLPNDLRSPRALSRTSAITRHHCRSGDGLERRGLGDRRRGVVVDHAQIPVVLVALGPLTADQRSAADVLVVELDRPDHGVELGGSQRLLHLLLVGALGARERVARDLEQRVDEAERLRPLVPERSGELTCRLA